MPEMRGAAFLSFLDALEQLRGPTTLGAVRASLPAELRDKLDRGVITRVGWYPLADYSALHTATDAVVRGGEALAMQIGRRTTEIDTRGLIRYVLAIASPELLMRHAPLVFSSYVRGASVSAELLAPRRYLIGWEGMTGATRLVHAELEAGTGYLVEKTGGKAVTVTPRPSGSASEGRFEIAWE